MEQTCYDAFLEYLKSERNYSPRTVESYSTDLKEFATFCEELNESITWQTVDADIVRAWIVDCLDNGKMKASSVNRKLSAVRTMYHYLVMMGVADKNPARNITGPKRGKVLPAFVREGEMAELLDGAHFQTDFAGQRDRLIILMFYDTGMRIAELLGLRDRDIDFSGKSIKVTGKRDKQRIIPFGEELEQAMKDYMLLRDQEFEVRDQSFFLGNKGKAVSRSKVERVVKSYLTEVTSIKKRSPHVLRHTFATTMLNHKADLVAIQNLLGHASLRTTEVYTHTSFEELKSVYKDAHPRD